MMGSESTHSGPLGILGGTFDPVHFGHLRLAQEALEQLSLANIRWIPAGQPPHRGRPGASAEQRLAMVRLATAQHPNFCVDEAEVLAPKPSYTIATLRRLRAELGPTRPLVLLMGGDAFLGLSSWHEWQQLFELAHIAVATRPGHSVQTEKMPNELMQQWQKRLSTGIGHAPAGNIVPFAITPLAISATHIRATLAQGHSPRYLLPESVLAYVQKHSLYL